VSQRLDADESFPPKTPTTAAIKIDKVLSDLVVYLYPVRFQAIEGTVSATLCVAFFKKVGATSTSSGLRRSKVSATLCVALSRGKTSVILH
jgi:hypothetical protein